MKASGKTIKLVVKVSFTTRMENKKGSRVYLRTANWKAKLPNTTKKDLSNFKDSGGEAVIKVQESTTRSMEKTNWSSTGYFTSTMEEIDLIFKVLELTQRVKPNNLKARENGKVTK